MAFPSENSSVPYRISLHLTRCSVFLLPRHFTSRASFGRHRRCPCRNETTPSIPTAACTNGKQLFVRVITRVAVDFPWFSCPLRHHVLPSLSGQLALPFFATRLPAPTAPPGRHLLRLRVRQRNRLLRRDAKVTTPPWRRWRRLLFCALPQQCKLIFRVPVALDLFVGLVFIFIFIFR